MKTALRLAAAAAIFAIVLAGCGGGGDGGPVAPQTDEIEPNDFTPQSLGTRSGSDTTVTAVAGGITASGQGDVDLFLVTLAAPCNLFVGVSASTDLELSISNNQGIFVRHVDTPGTSESCTVGPLPVGDYLVRVAGFDSQVSTYQITVGPR